MKVVLGTHGRFHIFDLARELQRHGVFGGIWTSYPRQKVSNESLPPELIHTYPFLKLARHVLDRVPRVPRSVLEAVEWRRCLEIDRATRREMPQDADVLIAQSMGGLEAGRAMRARGGLYLCDRGSTHCLHQEATLVEEYARFGLTFPRLPPRAAERETAEYAEADAILVPTRYVKGTFVTRGVAAEKVRVAPYGVELSRFYPEGSPPSDTFEVLHVGVLSIRKGIPDLLAAFERFDHPRKRLTLVGGPTAETAEIVARAVATGRVVATGAVSRDEVRRRMSQSHVLVLASVEEGMALVQAQALACGLPVVASPPTGCEDLYTDGVEGFILPSRTPDAIADALGRLADEPGLRERMSEAARRRVAAIGGWEAYGNVIVTHLRDLWAFGPQ